MKWLLLCLWLLSGVASAQESKTIDAMLMEYKERGGSYTLFRIKMVPPYSCVGTDIPVNAATSLIVWQGDCLGVAFSTHMPESHALTTIKAEEARRLLEEASASLPVPFKLLPAPPS